MCTLTFFIGAVNQEEPTDNEDSELYYILQ